MSQMGASNSQTALASCRHVVIVIYMHAVACTVLSYPKFSPPCPRCGAWAAGPREGAKEVGCGHDLNHAVDCGPLLGSMTGAGQFSFSLRRVSGDGGFLSDSASSMSSFSSCCRCSSDLWESNPAICLKSHPYRWVSPGWFRPCRTWRGPSDISFKANNRFWEWWHYTCMSLGQ